MVGGDVGCCVEFVYCCCGVFDNGVVMDCCVDGGRYDCVGF